MSQYRVTITMSQDTITALMNGGYRLQTYKSVSTPTRGGFPLLWSTTNRISTSTDVTWEDTFQGYTSRSTLVPMSQIMPAASYPMDLGQVLNVTNASGTGSVVGGGTPGAIMISNQTATQMSCGLSQSVGGISSPVAAFPLYPQSLDAIAPIEKVLVLFSTMPMNAGTVVSYAPAAGVLIDLAGTTSRQVNYDINSGWSWGDAAWGQAVRSNADLGALLILEGLP